MYKWEGQIISDSSSAVHASVRFNLASVDSTSMKDDLLDPVEWSNYIYLILFVAVIYTFYLFMRKKG